MARDYSNRGNNNRNKKQTKGSGSRSPNKSKPAKQNKRKQSSGAPGWVWLVSGLCIGLIVAAFVYIISRPTSQPDRTTMQVKVPQPDSSKAKTHPKDNQAASEKNTDTNKQSDKPRFAFYKMLPDYDVVIPQESYPEDTGDTDSGNSSHTQEQPTETQPTTPTVRQPGTYIIQAGSFSTRDDADRRRAELTLLGINARVVQHELDNGRVVYRVRTVTIESNDKLTDWIKRLRAEGIGTLVLRKSD